MNTCTASRRAIAAGEPPDPSHLRGCEACRRNLALTGSIRPRTDRPRPMAPPTSAGLRAVWRRRVATRAAVVGAAGGLLALLVLGRAPSAPPREDLDLLAVLDEADRAVEPAEMLDEDLLALFEPADPAGYADPLVDALLGTGSL